MPSEPSQFIGLLLFFFRPIMEVDFHVVLLILNAYVAWYTLALKIKQISGEYTIANSKPGIPTMPYNLEVSSLEGNITIQPKVISKVISTDGFVWTYMWHGACYR